MSVQGAQLAPEVLCVAWRNCGTGNEAERLADRAIFRIQRDQRGHARGCALGCISKHAAGDWPFRRFTEFAIPEALPHDGTMASFVGLDLQIQATARSPTSRWNNAYHHAAWLITTLSGCSNSMRENANVNARQITQAGASKLVQPVTGESALRIQGLKEAMQHRGS